MKPDKRKLATLHDMETWAYKVRRDAKEWTRTLENVFNEELQGISSFNDIVFFLDDNWGLRNLLVYIENAKKELEL